MYNYPLFAPKQTFARIDFLRQVRGWWTKRVVIMLKFLLKSLQRLTGNPVDELTSSHVNWSAR